MVLWVVCVTAGGILWVAFRDMGRERGDERPSFREVMWEGETREGRRGSEMEKGEIVVGEGGD